jgi:hypothetical protein
VHNGYKYAQNAFCEIHARECEFSDSHYADGTSRRVQKNAVQLIHTPLCWRILSPVSRLRETTRPFLLPFRSVLARDFP